MDRVDLVGEARRLSQRHLEGLGRRWDHVQAVAGRAEDLAQVLPLADRPVVVAAAWLHDIGYAPALALSGFHPVDGADYLERLGAFTPVVIRLVAHHTGAAFEADERGLLDRLAIYPEPPQPLLDVLTAADVLTGPDGQPVEPVERIAEILRRYDEPDPVHRAVSRSGPHLVTTAETVRAQLASLGSPIRYLRSDRDDAAGDRS